MSEYNFTINIDNVTYSNDVFLEKLRNYLNEYNIDTNKSKEKTGHANTVGAGIGFGGVGVGRGTTDIIAHQWNPFEIKAPANKFKFFGKFEGVLKVNELSHYLKKKKEKNINFKNYEIYGEIKFCPHTFLTIVIGSILWLLFGLIFTAISGFIISIISLIIYYNIIKSKGFSEVNYPVTLIEKSINDIIKII